MLFFPRISFLPPRSRTSLLAHTQRNRPERQNIIAGEQVWVQTIKLFVNCSSCCEYDLLTALAGKALSMTGVKPRYKAITPSFCMISAMTLRAPLGYLPSGAVCAIITNAKFVNWHRLHSNNVQTKRLCDSGQRLLATRWSLNFARLQAL